MSSTSEEIDLHVALSVAVTSSRNDNLKRRGTRRVSQSLVVGGGDFKFVANLHRGCQVQCVK
jgi:hypothetical protein